MFKKIVNKLFSLFAPKPKPSYGQMRGTTYIFHNAVAANFGLITNDPAYVPPPDFKMPNQIGPGRRTVLSMARDIAKRWRIGHEPGRLAGIGERQARRRNAVYLRKMYERKYGNMKEVMVQGPKRTVSLARAQAVDIVGGKFYKRRISLSRWMYGAA